MAVEALPILPDRVELAPFSLHDEYPELIIPEDVAGWLFPLHFVGTRRAIFGVLERKMLFDLQNPRAQDINSTLVLDPGAHSGAYAVGAAETLIDTDLLYGGFTRARARSIGALALAYAAGRNRKAAEIVDKWNAENEFMALRNIRNEGGYINYQWLIQEILTRFPITPESLADCPTELLVGIIPRDGENNGKLIWVDIRKVPNPQEIVLASACIPRLYGIPVGNLKHVKIDGIPHNDGGLHGTPYDDIMADEADHIVYIRNNSIPQRYPPFFIQAFEASLSAIGAVDPDPTRKTALRAPRNDREKWGHILAAALDTRGRKWAIFEPRIKVSPNCMDGTRLRRARYGARVSSRAIIDSCRFCYLHERDQYVVD